MDFWCRALVQMTGKRGQQRLERREQRLGEHVREHGERSQDEQDFLHDFTPFLG